MPEGKLAWVIGYANDSSGEVVIHEGELGRHVCTINYGTKNIKDSIEVALRICRAVNVAEGRLKVGVLDSHTMAVLERATDRAWFTTDFVKGADGEA